MGGFLIIFKIQQETIQNNFRERISNNLNNISPEISVFEKTEIENSSSKIICEKEGKEFRYNGKLYDIISSKKSNGKTYLYCWNDKEEEELFNSICIFVNKNLSENNFITSYLPFYIIPEFKTNPPSRDVEAVCISINNFYKNFLLPVPAPPPRQV